MTSVPLMQITSSSSIHSLIYACSRLNDFKQVLSLFSRLLSRGHVPDAFVLPTVLKACTALNNIKAGRQLHAIATISGFHLDPFVQSSLVHMYVKCSKLKDARKLLDEMFEPDVISWSAVVAGYARLGHVSEAKEAVEDMEDKGIAPNVVCCNGLMAGFSQCGYYSESVLTFQKMHSQGLKHNGTGISSVLPAVGDLEDLILGNQIHGYVIKLGTLSDKCIVSALIDMYGKCGCCSQMSKVFDEMDTLDVGACSALVSGLSRNGLVDEALMVFWQFKDKGMDLNVISWTSVITACSQNGKDMEALDLFREMQFARVKPNSITIPSLLPACGNTAALIHGKAAHGFSIRIGISDDVYVGSALIDMYAKCGRIKTSRLCFDRMPTRNLVSWNAILGGYAMHGKAKEAIEIFHLMQRGGQKPDLVSFTGILSACSQSGLTEEGQCYFNSMSEEHGIEPSVEHYSCMVSLLGRAGKLEEAYSMIKKMPFEPDGCVWGALLSFCRVHNNMKLGEIAAIHLFKLEPTNPGNYILMSNIYASKGKWREVNGLRDMMSKIGLRKDPGCSWIEVKPRARMLLSQRHYTSSYDPPA